MTPDSQAPIACQWPLTGKFHATLTDNSWPIAAVVGESVKQLGRAHLAAVVFSMGLVWYMDRRWADEVIDQCAEFPNAAHDDLVDCVTQAVIWVRKLFQLLLADEDEEPETPKPKTRVLYG